jgi:hypothetical protein
MPVPIVTFVNDVEAYEQMLRSFSTAGFTGDRATFAQLTARDHELEPYGMITKLVSGTTEPYFVLCHQDVRLDCGHGFDDLTRAIDNLERQDPLWAVAGNAGGRADLRVVRFLTDPHGGPTLHPLPMRVHSLDENFLVIKSRTGVQCSVELAGFHFYGSDICLNALAAGRSAYVIPFQLRHLSAGTRDESYDRARERFVSHWSRYFRACYFRTTTEVLFFSRSQLLRSVLGHPRLRKILKNHFTFARVVGAALGHGTTVSRKTCGSHKPPDV